MDNDAKPTHLIGIDVGGTKIAGGLIALPEARLVSPRTVPTNPSRGGRPVLDDVLGLSRELAAEARSLGSRVELVGLGLCELVDREGQIASANCIRWLDQPVRRELSTIAPTFFEADVRAGAIAEATLGAGRGFSSFLYVTVGTGISCCLMLEGRPHLGARGVPGTMASSPLSLPCEKCDHVSHRTLEEIASGPALVERFKAAGGQASRGPDVVAAAEAGDSRALQIVRSAGEALGSQVALMINTLDPEAVIIGGGLGLSQGPYRDQFITSTRQQIWSSLQHDLPILRGATGPDAGWIGAAIAAWQRSGRTFPVASQNLNLNESKT